MGVSDTATSSDTRARCRSAQALAPVASSFRMAGLEDAAEDLLERLGDIGVAVEDATVADVTGRHRANATVFNRIAQALAQDVVAVLPTAGADDPEGCEAAASAVHRSVASGAAAGDAAAATRRVEQGLRRLGTAIDKSSPAAACETHELLEMLATYVQAGTMLARTRANRDDGDDEGRGERPPPTDVVEAPMDVEEAVVQSGASSGSGCVDLVQSERASRATWRLVDALAPLDPGVAAAAKVVDRNGRNGRNGSPRRRLIQPVRLEVVQHRPEGSSEGFPPARRLERRGGVGEELLETPERFVKGAVHDDALRFCVCV
mmetsp:Transcript_3454/g.12964  ORF Transcript_3454/g.12964 Transcript_3454/m.12964 type:complete len:319 (+) Transcript_3454:322-1278(+)